MIILGLSCYYHDAAACILIDGTVIAAAQEERFTRIKHDNSFPKLAIKYCLEWSGLIINQIDTVIFYEKPIVKFDRLLAQSIAYFPSSRSVFTQTIGSWFKQKLRIKSTIQKELRYKSKIFFIPHHLSHAASSYYFSGFNKSAIVTFDGVGEWATTTVGTGQGNQIKLDKEIRFPHSLGLFYSTMTAYLGFAVNNDEYKVMGLAAYGNPKKFKDKLDQLVKVFPDGSFALEMKYFKYGYSDRMPSRELETLLGYPIRQSESTMQHYYEDIAAATQVKLEEVVFQLLTKIHKQYKTDNLCLAGGVALNSVLNGKLLSQTPFKNIYIPPDPGDGGGALGAAMYYWKNYGHKDNKNQIHKTFSVYLGPDFTDAQIKTTLDFFQVSYTKHPEEQELIEIVAELLQKQQIIGWFQGRMEWGPRALGNRSILASAATNEMKDIINAKVKHREMFRPFAPVILAEHVNNYFVTDAKIPESAKYMLLVYPFKKRGMQEVPATVHVDGSGRLQTLTRDDNPLYYDLIKTYYKKTGTPIIINTSFNIRGEPIVCTPKDAVKCFLGTEIDYLAIGHYLVRKEKHD